MQHNPPTSDIQQQQQQAAQQQQQQLQLPLATQPESLPGNSLTPPSGLLTATSTPNIASSYGQHQVSFGSNTIPPNSPSSSNSTSSPGFNSFPNSTTMDKSGMSGQTVSSPSAHSVNPYGAQTTTTPGMDKLTSSSYGHYAATVGAAAATSVPEWYQQMGYHQYYAQGGDPYGLNNSQVG